MRNFFTLLLFSTFLIFGCSKTKEAAPTVATVNGTPISKDRFLALASPLVRPPLKTFSSYEGRKALLDDVIQQEVLIQVAVASKMIERSDRIRRMIAQEYLEEKMGYEKYEPSQDEITKYFEQKKEEFEKIKASHILIKPYDVNDAPSWEEAKKRAEIVLKKIKAQGEKADFVKLAKDFSDDESNKNTGGELPFFTRKQMVADFSSAAFELKKVGDVSGVIKTPYGYHIIKLTGDQRGFDEALPTIKMKIGQEKRTENSQKLLKELTANAKININEEVLSTVQPK